VPARLGQRGLVGALADYLHGHGLPDEVADELRQESRTFAPSSASRATRVAPRRRRVDGWRVLEFPGHADGHICLERDGVLVAGDQC